MAIDIALALENGNYLYQGAVSQNSQQQYDAIQWLDTRPKPTWAQLNSQANINYTIAQINASRKQVLQTQISFYGTVEVIKLLIQKNVITANDLSQRLRDAYNEWKTL